MSDMQDNETVGAKDRYGSIVNIISRDAKDGVTGTRNNINIGSENENNQFLVLNSQSEAPGI
jgi:hypothetical protein